MIAYCGDEPMESRRMDCDQEFSRIWKRLDKGDKKFEDLTESEKSQEIEISILKTNMIHLIGSMSKLTGAIWGMTGSILLILIGFFIWFVQQH